jgi:hypothetical protein
MEPQIEFFEVFAVTDNAHGTVDLSSRGARSSPGKIAA